MKRDRRQILTEFLVLSAQGGKESAFRQLHEIWSADLRRLALLRIEKSDEVDVVTQEAWLAIARGLSKLDDPACFPRWAFRIVERRAADWIRKRQSERRRSEAWRNDQTDLSTVVEPSSENEVTEKVKRAIAGLDPESRELVYLFYQAERSTAEIAAILGVPIGTVKSRLSKARATIRKQIERIDNEGPR